MKFILIICAIFFTLFILKLYIYKRFLRDWILLADKKWLSITFLVILSVGEALFYFEESIHFIREESLLSPAQHTIASLSFVIGYALLMACLCADILKSLICLAQNLKYRHYKKNLRKPTPAKLDSQSDLALSPRRQFLKTLLDYGALFLSFCFGIKSFFNALEAPSVRQVQIKLENLKAKKTIAMISDVHIGKTLGAEFLSKIVAKINALKPDIVVIVGDLVDDRIQNVKESLKPLKDIQSKEGVYYVAGNHEYYHGIDSILEYLSTLNLKILHNTNIELEDLNLSGVSDLAGVFFKQAKPDLQSARQGLNPHKPSILLAHQPKFVRQNDVSDFDLVLCGHTHAGQVFPLSFFVWLDQHYIHGLYRLPSQQAQKKTQLYVSSGAGFWGPPIRFLAPSEIVEIRLEAQD